MKVQGRRKRGRPRRRWLYRVRDDIKKKGLSVDKLDGGVCHYTLTPHKSGTKMRKKKDLHWTSSTISLCRVPTVFEAQQVYTPVSSFVTEPNGSVKPLSECRKQDFLSFLPAKLSTMSRYFLDLHN